MASIATAGSLPAALVSVRHPLSHCASSLLTVIITTSPVVSNPSTLMLDTLLASFKLVTTGRAQHNRGTARACGSLEDCARVIVCDGYTQPEGERRIMGHGKRNPRYRRRKNISEAEAANYDAFVAMLLMESIGIGVHGEDSMVINGDDNDEEYLGSRAERIRRRSGKNVKILPCRKGERLGFALALREALALVETEFVMVVQHDWAFLRDFPLDRVLNVMQKYPEEIKYVGLPSSSSINYLETASVRDPDLRSSMTSQEARFGLPLYPLLFWFDKTHICRTEHYRTFVFGQHHQFDADQRLSGESAVIFKRGDFIEDTLGHRQLADIRAHGFSAHAKYGTFLFDDGGGEIISHLDGRRFLTPSQRERKGWQRHVVRSAPAYVREVLKAKVLQQEEQGKADGVTEGDTAV